MPIGVDTIALSSNFRSRSCSMDLAAEGGLTSSDPNDVREWLYQSGHRKQIALLDKFLIELRRGRMISSIRAANANQSTSLLIAHRIVNLLRHMIGSTNWRSAADLLCILRGTGRELQVNGRGIVAIGNIVRRIMAAVREETEAALQEETKKLGGAVPSGRLSLESMLWALPQHVRSKGSGGGRSLSGSAHDANAKILLHHSSDVNRAASYDQQDSRVNARDEQKEQELEIFPEHYYTQRSELKQAVMEGIQEILTDLEDLHKNINEQATNHIHTGEVILTIGQSKTVELFLKSAAKSKRIFQVIVIVGNDTVRNNGTYQMAQSLADAGIETTVVCESAVFAVMARVHKVLLPARAVLANGGLVASVAGSNLVAIAAKHHSVPVQCITGLFKLCPRFPHEGQDTLNDLLSGQLIIGHNATTDPLLKDVEFINPAYDYIEPQHIGLYITNVGAFQPSFIYRMLAENYHTDDWGSFE
jgi:translation initiation factor eIF-2B subunit beta